ncbi:MAG TPA: FtsX-like permease family protein [Streptosporangiaceae bacterium]|nr:FtsX-like permease family protein [Streptosporangiaceae bacterium]
MNAHRLVIVAAALTTIVAAALATALATFSGQALPRAVRHDLAHATGTSLSVSGSVNASQAAQYSSILPNQIRSALGGTPFAFYQADWSDPLGFVPGALPAIPAAAGGNTQIAEAASLSGIMSQARLTAGRWPGAPVSGQPIPAALPATAAALLHVSPGDVLRMRDRISQGYVRFVITGLYRPRQVAAPYWNLSEIAPSGSITAGGFTTFGPLTVLPAAFAGSSAALAVNQGTWLAEPQTESIPAGQLTTVAANVTELRTALQDAQQLPSVAMTTSLPAVLTGTASDLDVARSLLAICAVLLFLLAAAALLAAARLLAGQREGESAMLTARGATRWQLVGMTATEAIPLCVLSSAAGGVLGVLLARVVAGGASGGESVGGPSGGTYLAAVAVAVAGSLIMLVPALSTVAPGAARARRGRQAAISGVSRAGADLALIVLAVLAGWQLRHYSAVSAGANGNFGIDPVVVVAPALALAGGTVLALRLLPAGGKAGDRLAARGRRLTSALASWQISRQPIRQGGAALLIVLAVATGTLALSQRQSWTRSDHDQAAFSAGADVRVDAIQPLSAAQAAGVVGLPGVRHAMPVARFPQTENGSEVIALNSSQVADVALQRADQSPADPAAVFGKIARTGPPPGVALPGRAAVVQLTARLGPASLGLAPVTVNVSVTDADNNVYELDAGQLPADGRDHTLSVNLANQVGGSGSGPGAAIYPLRLTSVSLDYTLPAKKPAGVATFTVDGYSAGPGTSQVAGAALRGWPAAASSTELADVQGTSPGTKGPAALPAAKAAGASGTAYSVTLDTGYGLAQGAGGAPPSSLAAELTLTGTPPATAALPAIATQRFLAATSTSVGSVVQTAINGAVLSVKIVGQVTTFPTVSDGGGALLVDLGSLQDRLTSGSLTPAQPGQWWLATSGGTSGPSAGPAGLAGELPPGSDVTSAAGLATGLLTDPLSTVPQQALLVVAIAAAVLAITGFCVSIAAGVRQRRAENALLAALGVPPRSAAGQLCLEKLMLSLPSAVAGLILGVVLAELLVPAITLTSSATTPVPPVLIQFGWAQTLPLALAVAVLPVLAAAFTIARRPDPAAALRAAEAA